VFNQKGRKMQVQPPFAIRVLCILWPSFVMAGVLEALVFSVVDPAELRWFGSLPIEWSSSAIYSVSFLLFWIVISTASALTHLLAVMPHDGIEVVPRPVR